MTTTLQRGAHRYGFILSVSFSHYLSLPSLPPPLPPRLFFYPSIRLNSQPSLSFSPLFSIPPRVLALSYSESSRGRFWNEKERLTSRAALMSFFSPHHFLFLSPSLFRCHCPFIPVSTTTNCLSHCICLSFVLIFSYTIVVSFFSGRFLCRALFVFFFFCSLVLLSLSLGTRLSLSLSYLYSYLHEFGILLCICVVLCDACALTTFLCNFFLILLS